MAVLLLSTITLLPFSNLFLRLGILIPLLFGVAAIQGFIGIFVCGATYDRRGLSKNNLLRRYTWIGMVLSIALLGSIAIGFGLVFVIMLMFP